MALYEVFLFLVSSWEAICVDLFFHEVWYYLSKVALCCWSRSSVSKGITFWRKIPICCLPVSIPLTLTNIWSPVSNTTKNWKWVVSKWVFWGQISLGLTSKTTFRSLHQGQSPGAKLNLSFVRENDLLPRCSLHHFNRRKTAVSFFLFSLVNSNNTIKYR